ncbi:MAG: hypothetical protein EB072_12005 [Betaproteobacteria bacterium]|nr:hypothetical protein [Betaproteobacteria bacterium]
MLKLSFDTEGASLVKTELRQFNDAEKPNQAVVLLDQSKSRLYLSQSGLIAPQGSLPTHKTNYGWVNGPITFKEGEDQIKVRFVSEGAPQQVRNFRVGQSTKHLMNVNSGSRIALEANWLYRFRGSLARPGKTCGWGQTSHGMIYHPAKNLWLGRV